MKQFIAGVSASYILTLLGCNTVKGVGQDLQKAGEKIECAAKK